MELTLEERLEIGRNVGKRNGARDGHYDANTYSGAAHLLEITVVTTVKRLDAIGQTLRTVMGDQGYNDALVDEARETAYLRAYITAWAEEKYEQ